MKEIKLTQDRATVVDDEDFEKFSIYNWYFSNTGYAVRKIYPDNGYEQKAIYLHREIINCPKGLQVDHINRNKLDNRKINLRIVTNGENQVNKEQKNTTGVIFKNGKYLARLSVNKKQIQLGTFTTISEARQAYIDGVKLYRGIDLT